MPWILPNTYSDPGLALAMPQHGTVSGPVYIGLGGLLPSWASNYEEKKEIFVHREQILASSCRLVCTQLWRLRHFWKEKKMPGGSANKVLRSCNSPWDYFFFVHDLPLHATFFPSFSPIFAHTQIQQSLTFPHPASQSSSSSKKKKKNTRRSFRQQQSGTVTTMETTWEIALLQGECSFIDSDN